MSIANKSLLKTGSLWYPKTDKSETLNLPLWHPRLAGSSFQSFDKTGFTATVTEATWGSQGRTFDGSNDKILISLPAASITSQQSGSLVFWFKPTTLDHATAHTLLGYGGDESNRAMAVRLIVASGSYYLNFLGWTAALDQVRGGTALVVNTWYLGVVSSDGSAWTLDLGTTTLPVAAETLTVVNGSNSGTWMGDISPTSPQLPFGILRNAGADIQGFKGIIGEAYSYSRVLSAAEKLQIQQVTKWRY